MNSSNREPLLIKQSWERLPNTFRNSGLQYHYDSILMGFHQEPPKCHQQLYLILVFQTICQGSRCPHSPTPTWAHPPPRPTLPPHHRVPPLCRGAACAPYRTSSPASQMSWETRAARSGAGDLGGGHWAGGGAQSHLLLPARWSAALLVWAVLPVRWSCQPRPLQSCQYHQQDAPVSPAQSGQSYHRGGPVSTPSLAWSVLPD